MSQSAIWDALLIAGDALQDGRLDDCDRVLVEIDAMGAWDFEHRSAERLSTLSSLGYLYKKHYPASRVAQLAARQGTLTVTAIDRAAGTITLGHKRVRTSILGDRQGFRANWMRAVIR